MRWTASQLGPCGYANVLSKSRKRTPSQRVAMDRGTLFHECVRLGKDAEDPEVQTWVVKARDALKLPPSVEFERALGLSVDGRHVPVEETEPHVYKPLASHKMLTAGRADVCWFEAPVAVVGDMKTGRDHLGPPERLPQIAALGFAAADAYGAEAMRLGVYYARDGVWEWSEDIGLDSDKAAELWDMVSTYARVDESPRPGTYCGACWERKGCAHAA